MQLENALMTADTSADELKSVVSAYPEMDADRFAVTIRYAATTELEIGVCGGRCHEARLSTLNTAGSTQYV